LFRTSNLLTERTKQILSIDSTVTVSEWRPSISCELSCLSAGGSTCQIFVSPTSLKIN